MELTMKPEYLKSLSALEYTALEYIVKHKSEVKNMSIQELAAASFSSTATIMRLCKKLNYRGYSELKYSLNDTEPLQLKELDFNNTIDIICNEINTTAQSINQKQIKEICDLLHSGKNIHFFAKGITRVPLTYFSKYLLTCGRHSTDYEDTHIALLNAAKMTENDVLFVASVSGATTQVIRVVQIAKARGATVICFTSMSHNNYLSQICDINFLISAYSTISGYDVMGRISLFFIIDLIILNYCQSLEQ